ncbi:MAG: peptide deformylase [Ignavibacteria bacterium]|nr:peptide deformylase [Ignavibacteria bacterium]
MILPVTIYNHPILKQKTTPIAEITEAIDALVRNMFETMYQADGVGLAANQVGKGLSVTVIDTQREDDPMKPLTLINPIIESFSDETVQLEEGCLSLPDFRDQVVRPSAIQVRYWDLEMHEHVLETDDLLARVIQHEVDHLNGIYFFERLTPLRRTLAKGKLYRIGRGDYEAEYLTIKN